MKDLKLTRKIRNRGKNNKSQKKKQTDAEKMSSLSLRAFINNPS